MAIAAGADAVGLVARMPSGPGPIADDLIHTIAKTIPPPVSTFLLTSEVEPDAVVDHVRRTGVNVVQLVDDAVGSSVWTMMRDEMPWIRIVQVIHVRDQDSIDLAMCASQHVDALLLDSGNPSSATRELGGTGRTHDWSMSREIVQRSPIPVFLAGGINPVNVAEAITSVRPYGIDLCSGVRTDGELDRALLERLCSEMRRTDLQLCGRGNQ